MRATSSPVTRTLAFAAAIFLPGLAARGGAGAAVEASSPPLEQVAKESDRAYNFDPQNKNIKDFHENLREKINALNKN